jgi:hypothetical protein
VLFRLGGKEQATATAEADPYGMTNKRTGDGKGDMRGSLHCGGKVAAFGRDDVFFRLGGKNMQR